MRLTAEHLDRICGAEGCGRPLGTHSLAEYVAHTESAPIVLTAEEVEALCWAIVYARVRGHGSSLASVREKLAAIDARAGR